MNSERWQKVKSILEGAIEVAPPSRAAYLDKACRGDENLRSEVESLLAFESADEDELEEPAFSMLMQKSFDSDEALIGKRFGNYKISKN
jgi:serine/threonine-protein kinase